MRASSLMPVRSYPDLRLGPTALNHRYLVAGGWANWSGGPAWAPVPSASDDVFIDANSPNPAVLDAITCKSLNLYRYEGTVLFQGTISL